MAAVMVKGELSPARERLLKLMQEVNFGRIGELIIRDGEPVFDPQPRVIREVKFCAQNGPRPEAAKEDFALKRPVLDLFAHLDALGNGTIRFLEVKHGLPFRMAVEEDQA